MSEDAPVTGFAFDVMIFMLVQDLYLLLLRSGVIAAPATLHRLSRVQSALGQSPETAALASLIDQLSELVKKHAEYMKTAPVSDLDTTQTLLEALKKWKPEGTH